MSDGNTTTKEYSGYLIVNWRDDRVRYRKTEPNNLNPTELAIPHSTTVTVPEIEVPEVGLDVDVPPATVEHAVAEAAERIAPVTEPETEE